MEKIGKRVRLILSTGRTGTTYLCLAFNEVGKNMLALQEPLPSRYIYLSANASNRFLADASLALRWYEKGLRKRLNGAGDAAYIEFNPYLCPFAEKLHLIAEDLHVVHIVRDPRTWVPSQLDFGAYGFNRHFIDWIPFNMPGDTRRYREYGSGKISKTQQVIWRWSDFNRRIDSLSDKVTRYFRVRFEDLFSNDESMARINNELILKALDIEDQIDVSDIMHRPTENESARKIANAYSLWTSADRQYLDKAAGELIAKYGYGDSP